MAFAAGETVFFRHAEHAWLLGVVDSVSPDGKAITCVAQDAKRGVTGERVEKLKPATDVTQVMGSTVDEDVDDLLNLTILHESTLLRTLFIRYARDVIYTNIGAIVVALNPFTFSIPWYKDDYMSRYLDEGHHIEKNVPHTWAVSHNTYWELFDNAEPQFILVSGESGSGKTEASKIVVKYFSALSDRAALRLAAQGGAAPEGDSAEVGRRLQKCSPILEAYGNARTVRNDNSSRFGKFMKIQFSKDGVLLGSRITRYLLEKSRILTGAKGERVYHAFYLVCRGDFAKEFVLLEDKAYKSLNSGQQLRNPDFDTEEDFNEVISAMVAVGLDDLALRSVWATVAAIITLVNVEFVSDGGEGSAPSPALAHFLHQAAKLLRVDADKLQHQLLRSETVVRGEVNVRLHTPSGSQDVRDALCKALYDGLFGDLVDRCNVMCDANTDDAYWVGLLDIFGFEDFEKNSFEQLCINLANETLQGHYNAYVFNKDLEECAAEGINTVDIVCPDNTPCLNMVSDPKVGIFALLDDECSLGKGSDKGFLDATLDKFKAHPDFVAFKISKVPSFGVVHYAGTVTYDVAGFLDKNRDTLKDGLRLLMRESANSVVANLLAAPVPKTGRAQTVSGFFRQQLAELMAIINSSHPHWIRCIKPHPAKKPRLFQGRNTMLQLESSGVLGTVKIRKAGYPVRIHFSTFLDRFAIFLPWKEAAALTKGLGQMPIPVQREQATMILSRPDLSALVPRPSLCQIGKTKVFMKSEGLTPLEKARRDETTWRVARLQALGRAYLARKPIMRIAYHKAIAHIVTEFRAYLDRTRAVRERRAAAERAFREAMAAGTAALVDAYAEAARASLERCFAGLVDVYIAATLEREPLLRVETRKAECGVWVNLLITCGEELLSRAESDLRARIARIHAAGFHMLLAEHTEHQLFCLVTHERDGRAALAGGMLEELRVAAGDPEVRMTLLLGMEAYRRQLLAREGLGVYASWLQRHGAAVSGTFFSGEVDARRALLDEEAFERDVRKRFERKRVWFALADALFADEAYDREFLHRSQDAYRGDVTRSHAAAVGGSGGSVTLAAKRAELVRREQAKRESLVLAESGAWVGDVIVYFARGADSIRLDEAERDESKFRRIVSEAFFVTLAVRAHPAVYAHYLACCRAAPRGGGDEYFDDDDDAYGNDAYDDGVYDDDA